MVPEDEVADKLKKLKKLNKNATAISVIDDARMEQVKKILNGIAAGK